MKFRNKNLFHVSYYVDQYWSSFRQEAFDTKDEAQQYAEGLLVSNPSVEWVRITEQEYVEREKE
jgi:hypothetical protein